MTRGIQYLDKGATGDELYRYRLERCWRKDPKTILFIMLNPSTADADQDDATIRRCVRFADRWGYGHLLVGNLFAWRATDPSDLWYGQAQGHDIVGPNNDLYLDRMIQEADTTVLAWGNHAARDPIRLMEFWRLLGQRRAAFLQLTAKGQPRHPLYTSAGSTLRADWRAAACGA